MDYSMRGSSVLHHLSEFAQIDVHWISDAISPFHSLPSVFPSSRVFSNESALHIRWPKYWSFSISPSSEYSGLISFKIDRFDLLAVQGTFKSLLQYRSLKASIFWYSASFWSNTHIHTWLLRLLFLKNSPKWLRNPICTKFSTCEIPSPNLELPGTHFNQYKVEEVTLWKFRTYLLRRSNSFCFCSLWTSGPSSKKSWKWKSESVSHSAVSDSLRPHGL